MLNTIEKLAAELQLRRLRRIDPGFNPACCTAFAAAALGITAATMRRRARTGKYPLPDRTISGRHFWRFNTIEKLRHVAREQ
jgi:hypothetical protein